MAVTLFFSNTMRVAAMVDDKGPRLQVFADGAELDKSAVDNLITVLGNWKRDIEFMNLCPECSLKSPLHRIGCRQAPVKF